MTAIPRPFTILQTGRPGDGTFTGLNGQTIVGDANGAWTITANGTNQNITLTPSGTGDTVLASGALRISGAAAGTGKLIFPAATTSAGGITFGTDTNLYRLAGSALALDGTGPIFYMRDGGSTIFRVRSDGIIGTLNNNSLVLQSNSTTALTLDSSQNALFSSGSNGQSLNIKHLTELTTIAAAATTDTTIQMPAGAIVLSVSVRVTVVIPTATSFSVGDSGSATRFSTANVNVAANSTDPGTKAGAYYNASALSVRLTMNGGTPADNSGRVRVTIAYLDCTVPNS